MFDRVIAAFSRRPAAFQVGLLFVATALPLIVASGFMFVGLAWLERQRLCEELTVRARTLAALVDDEIAIHAAVGWSLAASPQLREDDLAGFRAEAEAAIKFVPGSWVALSRPDGQIVLNTRLPPGRSARQPIGPRSRPRPQRQGNLSSSTLPRACLEGARALRRSSGLSERDRDVLDHNGDGPGALSRSLQGKNVRIGELAALVDRNKHIIARIPDQERLSWPNGGRGLAGGHGKVAQGVDGEPDFGRNFAVTAYAPTKQGWTVGIGIPDDQLVAPARRLLWHAAAVTIGLLALSVGLASLFAIRVNRGMSALACAAERVGAGEVVEAPEAPFAEARAIGAALACASAELKRRADLLAHDKKDLEAEVAWRSEELRREAVHKVRGRRATATIAKDGCARQARRRRGARLQQRAHRHRFQSGNPQAPAGPG